MNYSLFSKWLVLTLFLSQFSFAEESGLNVLGESQGYLLIELDVGGVAPSMKYAMRRSSRSLGEERTLALNTIDQRFYLIKLRKGVYQVTQVLAPLYDLPYRLGAEQSSYWQFKIEPGKINYFGRLHIKPERLTDYVEIRRLNYIAASYDDIQDYIKTNSIPYPLSLAFAYQDDYLRELLGSLDASYN
ncbi:hypothetical protein SAMN02745866_03963 [Alteromonadaceae bacterium Bs31]|nr:hypothetical protein SAMN02745866_03963 [Alteromonadaceae bacterium Bs31]